jgi:hypothetical protein
VLDAGQGQLVAHGQAGLPRPDDRDLDLDLDLDLDPFRHRPASGRTVTLTRWTALLA